MSALRIERDDDVLRVTLARPESRNAFDAPLIAELGHLLLREDGDREGSRQGEANDGRPPVAAHPSPPPSRPRTKTPCFLKSFSGVKD